MATKEIKGKAVKIELFKENAYKGNDSYNVYLEGDDTRYSYLCQGTPKIKKDVEDTFVVESREANGNVFWTIKLPKDPSSGGYQKREMPLNIFALDKARMLYNSSNSKDSTEKWDLSRMLGVAEYLMKKVNLGADREAVSTASAIACAEALSGHKIDSSSLDRNIKTIDEWIKKHN